MAVIYLKHPVHGAKVACSDMEAQNDRANGWVEFDPIAPAPLAPSAPVVITQTVEMPQEPVNSLAVEPRRRGRPRKEDS